MSVFQEPQPTAEQKKLEWFKGIESRAKWLQDTIEGMHKQMLAEVWEHPEFTAADYFAMSGEAGLQKLLISGKLQEVSMLANAEYVPFQVPNELTINPDGSVTVGAKK
jgi:hypothetical protein